MDKMYLLVKPIQLVSLFSNYITMFGDIGDVTDADELEKISYKTRDGYTNKDVFLETEIDETVFKLINDIVETINDEEFYEETSDNFKESFEKLIGIDQTINHTEDEDIKGEIYFIFKSNFKKSITELINKDPDFHPLTNFEEYKQKLLDMILKTSKDEDKDSE